MAIKLSGGQAPPNEVDKTMELVYGKPGVGKSAYAASHPSPLRILNCDRPMKSVLEQLPSHYEVIYEAVPLEVDGLTPNLANRYLLAFDVLVRDFFKENTGTLIVDGWDIFWDIVKIAKVPGLSDSTLPKEYEPANTYMNHHLKRLAGSPCPVVFTTIAEPIWSGAKTETGRMKSSGFKHRGRWLTHEIYLFSPDEKDLPVETPVELGRGQGHSAYVGTSKLNEKLVGAVIPNISYAMLYRMTFGSPHPQAAELWSPNKGKAAE